MRERLQEYLEFADYSDGVITADQVMEVGVKSFFFIDTRMSDQYQADHLPGAIHIEWREIISREDEIPADKPVVLYCDIGMLSAKAQFALRLLGHDNVKVLFGGLNGLKLHQQGMHGMGP